MEFMQEKAVYLGPWMQSTTVWEELLFFNKHKISPSLFLQGGFIPHKISPSLFPQWGFIPCGRGKHKLGEPNKSFV